MACVSHCRAVCNCGKKLQEKNYHSIIPRILPPGVRISHTVSKSIRSVLYLYTLCICVSMWYTVCALCSCHRWMTTMTWRTLTWTKRKRQSGKNFEDLFVLHRVRLIISTTVFILLLWYFWQCMRNIVQCPLTGPVACIYLCAH